MCSFWVFKQTERNGGSEEVAYCFDLDAFPFCFCFFFSFFMNFAQFTDIFRNFFLKCLYLRAYENFGYHFTYTSAYDENENFTEKIHWDFSASIVFFADTFWNLAIWPLHLKIWRAFTNYPLIEWTFDVFKQSQVVEVDHTKNFWLPENWQKNGEKLFLRRPNGAFL